MIKEWWRNAKKKYLPYPAIYLGKACLNLILRTCRIEIIGLDRFIHFAKQNKCVVMIWHNRLAIMPEIAQRFISHFKYRAVISNSRDGELLDILVNSYKGLKTLRVPHNSRHQALGKIVDSIKNTNEILVITPDGPRGPRYEVKPGIAFAAHKSQAYVIPLSWSTSHYWQLKTWDKLIFPRPFSRIVIQLGEPIPPSAEIKDDFESECHLLGNVLRELDKQTCLIVTKDTNLWPK